MYMHKTVVYRYVESRLTHEWRSLFNCTVLDWTLNELKQIFSCFRCNTTFLGEMFNVATICNVCTDMAYSSLPTSRPAPYVPPEMRGDLV